MNTMQMQLLNITKLHELSPWAKYTDRATAACQWS
jgi:hypothetical protein